MNRIGKLLMSVIIFMTLISCDSSESEKTNFHGEENAVALADQMFTAIGGKEAWCALRSLYIKAIHTEPQMSIPYQSEIWRGIDQFELVIEQQNDSFHVKAVVNEHAGTIRYYDKRDTSRILTKEQLKNWAFDHDHNIYVLLHNLACHPEKYKVEIDKEKRLAFYQDSIFLTSFGLDDQLRPHLFYIPNADGSISGSRFSQWGTDEGLIHSAGGHPLDSNFIYTTEIWKPGKKSLKEMFGEKIFNLE